METKEKIIKKIEELEQEHVNYCGYKMSECGCCSSIIDKLKKENSQLHSQPKEKLR